MRLVMSVARAHRRPQLRPGDRRGEPRGDPARPGRDRRLPRHRRERPSRRRRLRNGRRAVSVAARGRRRRGPLRRGPGASRASRCAVDEGEIVTLLGANGAGKTTTLRMLSGLHHPSRGTVTFRRRRHLDARAAPRSSSSGIGHVPEGRRIFPTMTVAENLEMGAYRFSAAAPRPTSTEIFELFPILASGARQLGGHALGRRAADARDRPRADGRAEAAAARRALDGPRAADRRARSSRSSRRSASRASTILLVEQNAAQALAWPTAATSSRQASSRSPTARRAARRRPRPDGVPRRGHRHVSGARRRR